MSEKTGRDREQADPFGYFELRESFLSKKTGESGNKIEMPFVN